MRIIQAHLPVIRFVLLAAVSVAGCKREADVAASDGGADPGRIRIPDVEDQPQFNYPEAVRSTDESLNQFIEDFTRACIAGEYDKYRLYTSRQVEPVGKDQFEKVYHRVKLVDVQEVRALQRISGLPYPLWLITSEIHLRQSPEEPVRKTMILAFKEQGQWVIAPAPRALRDAVAATRPTTQLASQPRPGG